MHSLTLKQRMQFRTLKRSPGSDRVIKSLNLVKIRVLFRALIRAMWTRLEHGGGHDCNGTLHWGDIQGLRTSAAACLAAVAATSWADASAAAASSASAWACLSFCASSSCAYVRWVGTVS